MDRRACFATWLSFARRLDWSPRQWETSSTIAFNMLRVAANRAQRSTTTGQSVHS